MFHKNVRILAVLFVLSLFATASYAQGGTAASGKDATATKKSKSDTAATKTKKSDLVDINAASKEELTALSESATHIARRSLMAVLSTPSAIS